MFTHLLITKFNLRVDKWKTSVNALPVLTEQWNENRFQLFLNYCFPSIKAQTNLNFEWLVFFDDSTSLKYRTIISELQTAFPNFQPIFINGNVLFKETISKYITIIKEDYLITTRLDNDDMVSIDFINKIQSQFNHQNYQAIDFIDGYTLQTKPCFKLGKRRHKHNPFISLIERNKNPKTVTSKKHAEWKRVPNVKSIKGERIWTVLIHSENMANRFEGFGVVDTFEFFEKFKLDANLKKNILSNLVDNPKWLSFKNYIKAYITADIIRLKQTIRGVNKQKEQ